MSEKRDIEHFEESETENIVNQLSVLGEHVFDQAFEMMLSSRNVIIWKFLSEAGDEMYKAAKTMKDKGSVDDIFRHAGYAWGMLICALRDLAMNGKGTQNELKRIASGDKTEEYVKKNYLLSIDSFREHMIEFEGKHFKHKKLKRALYDIKSDAEKEKSHFIDVVNYAIEKLL